MKYIIAFFLLLTNFLYGQDNSFDTTLVNSKKSFKLKTKAISNDLLLLTATSGTSITLIDTIESGGLAYIKYPDLNKDGNTDILMDYYGNNSNYSLYLFDPATYKFRKIESYSDFPDAIQLKSNPKYYYTYYRAGCADYNWVSDLFIIQNFKIIQLGHINGIGCEFNVEENPQVIEIYKVIKNERENKKLVEKLDYLKFISNFEDKWVFIEKYWNKNYTNFTSVAR